MKWREHRGGTCPTDPESTVMVRLRGVGEPIVGRNEAAAGKFRWAHRGDPGDITAYLVTAVPKEQEL